MFIFHMTPSAFYHFMEIYMFLFHDTERILSFYGNLYVFISYKTERIFDCVTPKYRKFESDKKISHIIV